MNISPSHEFQLAKWLSSLREEKGISQEALGVQLGKGQSDIAKIENGNKRVSVVELIAWLVALNIPVDRCQDIFLEIYDSLAGKKKESDGY